MNKVMDTLELKPVLVPRDASVVFDQNTYQFTPDTLHLLQDGDIYGNPSFIIGLGHPQYGQAGGRAVQSGYPDGVLAPVGLSP
jgi:hypothetical protein